MDFAQATLSGRPYKFKRRQFFIPLLFNLHDHLEPLEIFFFQNCNTDCSSSLAISGAKIFPKKFNQLGRVQQRDGQTDNGRPMP